MQEIIDGFLKFQRDAFPQRSELFRQLATSQHPRTLFISCSDSRLVPELVTQREPGDLFVIRNAGNIVPSYGPEPGREPSRSRQPMYRPSPARAPSSCHPRRQARRSGGRRFHDRLSAEGRKRPDPPDLLRLQWRAGCRRGLPESRRAGPQARDHQ